MKQHCRLLIALITLAAVAIPAPAADSDVARNILAEAMRDPAEARTAMAVLISTGDNEVADLLASMAYGKDEKNRVFALSALREHKRDASAVFADKLARETSDTAKFEALLGLIHKKTATDAQLEESLKSTDDWIRAIAGAELVRRGKAQLAKTTLSTVTGSNNASAASLARLYLLLSGDAQQTPVLLATVRDPQTPELVLGLILDQIIKDKISPAASIASAVAASDRSAGLRALAFQAASAVSADGGAVLRKVIASQEPLAIRAKALSLLADRTDAASQLASVRADETVAALVRFEQARADGKPQGAAAVSAVIAIGHPLVIDYVLDRADIDAAAERGPIYIPALLELVATMPAKPAGMTATHIRGARAASLLMDIGRPQDLAALKEILAERFNPRVRAVAGAMLKTKNKAVCDLARPLLGSPYEELNADAAITLGRFAQPDAIKPLQQMLQNTRHAAPLMRILTAWQLLRACNATPAATKDLAAILRQ